MKIIVIGSGPSGVHFALSALRKRHSVVMIDVGRSKPPAVLPENDFLGLKRNLPDPISYFAGSDYSGLTIPSADPNDESEYYGLPPSKNYVFERPEAFSYMADGLTPLTSFAAGGLAESWTAGSYSLNDDEFAQFPFCYEDIEPFYEEVAARIGVTGDEDDLAVHMPVLDRASPALRLDASSDALLTRYEHRRDQLIAKHKARIGRSRQAVLAQDLGERQACTYCGRCIWGCPNCALYTPSLTLSECRSHAAFTYIPHRFASHFNLSADGSIEDVEAYALDNGQKERHCGDAYVLACGTLSTSNVVLRSVFKSQNEIIRLPGLIDNRQVLAPFLNFAMLGKDFELQSYQYHQLAICLESERTDRNVHGQITTLTTATTHPIFQSLPFDLKSAIGVFRELRSSIGVVNLNFCDWRRDDNYLTLSTKGRENENWPALSIRYRPAPGEAATIKESLSSVRHFFFDLKAPLIPGMTHIRPMGASVHYSGTLPMSREREPWTVSRDCQSHDFENLFVVDGAVIPFLPAKNLTFTLMANAARVAATVF